MIWGCKADTEVGIAGRNTFLFYFNDEEDMFSVAKRSP